MGDPSFAHFVEISNELLPGKRGLTIMKTKMTMVYWKGERFWLGKLLDHPEIMTRGETLEELEENIKDAYLLMGCVPFKFYKVAKNELCQE